MITLKGGTSERKVVKSEVYDLAVAIIENANVWQTLDEAKADILSCIETLTQNASMLRIKIIVEQAPSLDELIRYCYNLRLKVEGLSIHRVLRGK